MNKEQWTESYNRKTKSWKSQPEFDEELAECSMSGLRFLKQLYIERLEEFKEEHNLDSNEEIDELQLIQQRYKMVNDELHHRSNDMLASPTYTTLCNESDFDAMTGIVHDKDNYPEYTVDFNEDETGYIYRDTEGSIIEETQEFDTIPKKSNKDKYKEWDYWK